MKRLVLMFLWSCTTQEPAPATVPERPPQADTIGIQAGVQHPPIPADSPAWRHDPGGFVPDHNFYGERSWDGVRMRVAGHIAVIERDRARLAAQAGDRPEAARRYQALADALTGMIPASGGPEAEIPTLARDAALRDAALLGGRPGDGSSGISGIRASLHRHVEACTLRADVAVQLRAELAARASAASVPELADFVDFDDRHALRVRLWSVYLDAVDPIGFSEPWGYFDRSAYRRIVAQLDAQIAEKAGVEAPAADSVKGLFTVDGAGGMPTGDSLIDVAGQPGPQAIGTLEKLGLDDPRHRQWVEDTVYVMNARMKDEPGGILSILHSRSAHLDGMGHGSRYYNIKQLRNETVRQLANAGHFDFARQALQMNFPLHHQDWECPNRNGILMAIDGRLAARGGAPEAAEQLTRARALTDAFLGDVKAAEAATR